MRGRSRLRTRGRTGSNSLLSRATALLGTAPLHYWDFTANRALFNSADVGAVTATPNWSFTRASTGYAQTLAGTLVSFGSGAPRLTDKGFLIEESRTNIALQSQTLDNATWVNVRANVSANAVVAPDSTLTADTLVEDATAASTHLTQQFITFTAATQSISIYAKALQRSQLMLFVPGAAFGDATIRSAYYDLATGTVGATSGSGLTASIESLGAGGWYRCILTLPVTLAAGVNVQVRLAVAGSDTYSGDGVSGLYLWGAQVEAAANHSSYITTTTVTVTRAADVPVITSPSVNYPLSIYAQFNRTMATYSINSWSIILDDASANNRSGIFVTPATSLVTPIVTSGGIGQYSVNIAGALGANVTTKTAVRISAATANSAKDGSIQAASGAITVPSAPTALRFGINLGSADWLNGYLLRAAIFNSALADAALQRATT